MLARYWKMFARSARFGPNPRLRAKTGSQRGSNESPNPFFAERLGIKPGFILGITVPTVARF
jgi:hypothetical protein